MIVVFVEMVWMKYASLLLRKFHWINLDRYVRLERLDG